MNCSPLQPAARTTIPPIIREWIGNRLRGAPPGPRKNRHAACLFALGRIGDFVLMLSALRLLIRGFGPADCVVVVPAGLSPLAAREFPDVTLITLPSDAPGLVRDILPIWWRERRNFSADAFEQRICLCHQRGLYYEVALSWIYAEKDVRLLPETYPTAPANGLSTELLAHWRLVETVLGHPVQPEEILPRFDSISPGNDGRLLVYPLSLDPARSVSMSHVTEVLQHWRKRSPAPIVFGAGPAEQIELERYANAARQAGLQNAMVESPVGIEGMVAHLARAGAVLAADSGAAHVAAALDKPLVLLMDDKIFGYANPWRRSPRQVAFLNTVPMEEVAAAIPAL
jgi:ADP-heptose:LPS heptosyltransferase